MCPFDLAYWRSNPDRQGSYLNLFLNQCNKILTYDQSPARAHERHKMLCHMRLSWNLVCDTVIISHCMLQSKWHAQKRICQNPYFCCSLRMKSPGSFLQTTDPETPVQLAALYSYFSGLPMEVVHGMSFPTHVVMELTPVLGGSWIEVRMCGSCRLFASLLRYRLYFFSPFLSVRSRWVSMTLYLVSCLLRVTCTTDEYVCLVMIDFQ